MLISNILEKNGAVDQAKRPKKVELSANRRKEDGGNWGGEKERRGRATASCLEKTKKKVAKVA